MCVFYYYYYYLHLTFLLLLSLNFHCKCLTDFFSIIKRKSTLCHKLSLTWIQNVPLQAWKTIFNTSEQKAFPVCSLLKHGASIAQVWVGSSLFPVTCQHKALAEKNQWILHYTHIRSSAFKGNESLPLCYTGNKTRTSWYAVILSLFIS